MDQLICASFSHTHCSTLFTRNNVFFREFVTIHLVIIVTRTTTGLSYPFTAVLLFFSFSLISLIVDGPHHYHPACGH